MAENFEQQIESMRQQQAQSAFRIQQVEAIILELARGTRDRFHTTDERLDDVDVKIAALVDAQIRTEESVKKTGEIVRALADSQTRTEESVKEIQESVKKTAEALRRLTALIDRYISERRNGGSGNSTNPEE